MLPGAREGNRQCRRRGADVQLTENIFRRRIGALRLRLLRLHMSDLGLRVTFFLFLLHQFEVRFRSRQLIFGLLHFAG